MGTILGIDPGKTGALAWLSDDGFLIEVADMPTVEVKVGRTLRARVSPALLARVLERRPVAHVVLEEVATRPGEGAVGAFAFGRGVGLIEGAAAALGIPITTVRPNVWKGGLQVPADKGAARQRAMQLWPGASALFARVKDDGRAEAALIGLYGCQRLRGASPAAIADVQRP